MLRCEVIVEGKGRLKGRLNVVDEPVSFLGMVNPQKGVLSIGDREIDVKGGILAFPYMVGSTVAPYIIYSMKKKGTAPLAIVVKKVDALLASGCALSEIPLLKVEENVFEALKAQNGREISVDTAKGVISYEP
ncbi:MAG: aconitase X swivel domain-containing protein [Nitrososphaeria archaeon]